MNGSQARQEFDWQLRDAGVQLSAADTEAVWQAIDRLLEAAYASGFDQGYSEGNTDG